MQSPSEGPTGSVRFRRRRVLLIVLLLSAVAAIPIAWHRTRDQVVLDDDVELEETPFAVNPGFVGAAACAECHAPRFEEFKHTRHFSACTLADGSGATAFGPVRGLHSTRDPNLQYVMERSGTQFTATAVQRTPLGPLHTAYAIGLVYGAGGRSDEMYLAWDGNRLVNPPVAWLTKLERWACAVDSATARDVPPTCLECHNTWISHMPGTANEYRQEDLIPGVGCERCHGPGREHVARHREKPGLAAQAIVHPGRLSRQRLIEVCTQCHGDTRPKTPPFSYRPGEPLDAHFRTLHAKYPEDGQVANQSRSMQESKCFQKSEMTCVTCHNPHRAASPEVVRRACAQCHEPAACREQPRLPEAVRADCVGCHMPSRVWMNVRFHFGNEQYVPATERYDHRIAVHPEAGQAVRFRWLGTQTDAKSKSDREKLSADMSRHWLAEAEHRGRDGRLAGAIGAVREALKFDSSPATRQRLQDTITRMREYENLVAAANAAGHRDIPAAIALQKSILEIRPNSSSSRGELGTLLAMQGDMEEAVAHLQLAARLDPDDGYCVKTLAALRFRQGRSTEAAELFAAASEIEPRDADIHHGWGLTLLKLERWADAELRFRRALALRPGDAGGNDGLSRALIGQGRFEPALLHARRAVRLSTMQDARMLLTLADAYLAADRPEGAREALEKARLAAMRSKDADLGREIQARQARLK